MQGRVTAAQTAFTEIYDKDLWGLARLDPEPDREQFVADLLARALRAHNVRSVVEFGCGFWNYQTRLDWTGISYAGYDVVPGVIFRNRDLYATSTIAFQVMRDGVLPEPADMLFSKDVLQHLPLADVHYYLSLFLDRYRLILLINDIHPETNLNGDIVPGDHRALRLDLPPFGIAYETVAEWDAPAFGIPFRKRACLIRGKAP